MGEACRATLALDCQVDPRKWHRAEEALNGAADTRV